MTVHHLQFWEFLSMSRMHQFHRLQADKDNIIEKRNQGDNYRLCSWQRVRKGPGHWNSRAIPTSNFVWWWFTKWMKADGGDEGKNWGEEEEDTYLRLGAGVQDDRAIQTLVSLLGTDGNISCLVQQLGCKWTGLRKPASPLLLLPYTPKKQWISLSLSLSVCDLNCINI